MIGNISPNTRPPLPDQAARDRILTALDENILVEAAAGTGKTTSMVGRMVALLRQGKCSISTLAAVTFTRKAAAELRARFQIVLEKEARKSDGEEKRRLEEALRQVEQCFIGTIHSFCGRLLRERPVESQVDLAFEEVEPEEDSEIRREAWRSFSDKLIHNDPEGWLDEFHRLGLNLKGLEDSFVKFCDYPDVAEWPAPPPRGAIGDLSEVRQKTEEYLRRICALAPSLKAYGQNENVIPAYKKLALLFKNCDLNVDRELMEILSIFDKNAKIVQKAWPGGKNQACDEKERFESFKRDVALPTLEKWRVLRYGSIIPVFLEARHEYDALRAAMGKLNFQDLLMKAAALLKSSQAVRRYFRRRFTHLLVDEFQDTDPIQAEVMLLLTADDPRENDWRKCRPVAGSLFVVGDPKQSIYRFRRADIITYNEVKKIITENGGSCVQLSANFRSTPQIIAWVNNVFKSRFPNSPTPESPKYVPLDVGKTNLAAGTFDGIWRLSQIDGKAAERKKDEAERIAQIIRGALDDPQTIAAPREDGGPRKVSPGDFLILSPKKEYLTLVASKLPRYGIPHRVTGSSALNQLAELRMLYKCVGAAARPDNPVLLVGALRSELFGVSDAQLYQFKKAGGVFDFRRDVPPALSDEAATAIGFAFQKLRQYRQWLSNLPPVAAVELIAADSGLMALAASKAGGEIDAGSLAKVFELLRQRREDTWSVAQMTDYLARLVDVEEEYDPISALSQETGCVRIMNLHKAKGLEAPVVFLANPPYSNKTEPDMHIDRAGERVLGYILIKSDKKYSFGGAELLAQPENWEELSMREQLFLEAEVTRLQYVAATRAGSVFVITRPPGEPKKDDPWGNDQPNGEIIVPEDTEAPEQEEIVISPAYVDTALNDMSTMRAEALKPTYYEIGAKHYALDSDDQVEGWTSIPLSPNRQTEATARGEIIHMLLEAAIGDPQAPLDTLAKAACRESDLEADEATELAEIARAISNSDLFKRARKSMRWLAEVPFETIINEKGPDGNEVQIHVRGAIDLAFEEPDGWVIVDYKSDRITDPHALVEKYAGQVRLYAMAWGQLTGTKVKELGLYSTRAMTLIPVSVNP